MIEAVDIFPADDFAQPDSPWFCEKKDRSPISEFARQSAFVAWMRKNAPHVIVYAVPNGARLTDWQKIRRWREGAVDGASDLVVLWAPQEPWEPGRCFIAEFKDGTKMPDKAQREFLNRLYRAGVPCGVYRNGRTLVEALKAAGAPIRGEML